MRNREDRSPISPPRSPAADSTGTVKSRLGIRLACYLAGAGYSGYFCGPSPAGFLCCLGRVAPFGGSRSVRGLFGARCIAHSSCLSCRRISKPCAVSKRQASWNIGHWKRFRTRCRLVRTIPRLEPCGTLIANRWRNDIRVLKVGAPSPGLPARDPWAVRDRYFAFGRRRCCGGPEGGTTKTCVRADLRFQRAATSRSWKSG